MPLDTIGAEADAQATLRDALARFTGRIALVSSFGAESAVLLHMASRIDRHLPVILLDTGKLFPETLSYRDTLVARLGLTDVRSARPEPARIAEFDPAGTLWRQDPDSCCWQRKVEPLDAALQGFDAWITGRKRHQTAHRQNLAPIEDGPDGRVKINPLAFWDEAAIERYFAAHALPRHPLQAHGYASIGCATCTRAVGAGADSRAGRWVGHGKTECGIHMAPTKLEQRA